MPTMTPDVEIKVAVNLSDIDKKIEKVVNNLGRVFNPSKFAGFAMSIMFFGMALQRIFDTIWKQGTKTFQDVMHSVEGSVTQFDILNGSIAYLQFNIGQALEPIVALLVPIIDAMSEWINQHPELFKWLFVIGAVLGALFAVSGAGVLAINGFLDLGVKLGIFSTTASGAIAPTLGLGVALKALAAAAIIGGIILIVQWIWKMQEAMGGWGEFFKSIVRSILRAVVLLAEGFVWLGDKIFSALVWVFNWIIDQINNILQSDLVQWGAKKLGIDLGTIGRIKESQYEFGDALLSKYLEWEQTGILAPSKGYSDSNNLVPTYNVTNNVSIAVPAESTEAQMQKVVATALAEANSQITLINK